LDQRAAKSTFVNFPKGDTSMKHRIGCVVGGFLLLVLSLVQLTFAQAPAAPRLNLSGAAFICANQAATGNCPSAEFDPALGSMQNAQGTWTANVSLPQGVVVKGLRLCGNFNEVGSSITATLDRTPLTASSGFASAVAMANVQSTGASNKTQCFLTTKIANATIDNTKNQYYVVLVVPDNNGVIFTTVQVDY
jgi:hypothetical protein